MGDAVRDLNGDALAGVYGLLEPGGVVRAPLDAEVTFPEGGVTGDELWSLLYLAGYLTTDDTQDPTDSVRLRPLRIPNKEVSLIFSREVIKRFRGLVGGAHRLEGLHAALVAGDAFCKQEVAVEAEWVEQALITRRRFQVQRRRGSRYPR